MSDHKKTPEEVLAMYMKEQEANAGVNGGKVSSNESPASKVERISNDSLRKAAEENLAGPSLNEARDARRAEIFEDMKERHLGYIELPIEDLPTGGIFYPEGTRINIRAASGKEIRDWSMVNEQDRSAIDDALNMIIERCVTISFPPESGQTATWKDLKDIDRLYIIIAVRDFTFTDGHNELKVMINETKDVVIKKDNLKYVELPDSLLKYYNEKERCFTIPTTNSRIGKINFYLPSVGVAKWCKEYVIRKGQAQEPIDTGFIQIAPMLIKDYRGWTDRKYTELVTYSMNFSIYDWSVISKVRELMVEAVVPKISYVDESGAEQEAPLNFRTSIKEIFLMRLDELGL